MKPASVRAQDKTALEFVSRNMVFLVWCSSRLDRIDRKGPLDRLGISDRPNGEGRIDTVGWID